MNILTFGELVYKLDSDWTWVSRQQVFFHICLKLWEKIYIFAFNKTIRPLMNISPFQSLQVSLLKYNSPWLNNLCIKGLFLFYSFRMPSNFFCLMRGLQRMESIYYLFYWRIYCWIFVFYLIRRICIRPTTIWIYFMTFAVQ